MSSTSPTWPEATLGAVLDCLGSELVEILAAPAGLEVAVSGPAIHDLDDVHCAPDEIVLAVSVDPSRLEAIELLRQVSASGAAAVVVKLRHRPSDELMEAVRSSTVALLGAPPELAWGQLHTLLRTAVATAGRGLDDAPVGDLFALANAVAGMVGGPATIEDTRSNVLAYSHHGDEIDEGRRATILGHRVPDRWLERLQRDGVFQRLWREEGPLIVEPEGLRRRLAIAVRAGGEILGSIWVQEDKRPFDAEAEVALREAARIAALHFIRHRSGEDLERSRRTELLRSVLDGRAAPQVLASALGGDPATITIVAFELEVKDRPVAEVSALTERAASLLTLHSESYRRPAAAVAVDRFVYVLLPDAGEPNTDRDRLLAFVTQAATQAESALGVGLRAAIASTRSLADVLDARHEADRALRALVDDPRGRQVARIEDVRPRAVLVELTELASGRRTLRAGPLEMLAQLDRDRRTSYVPTLRAYLDAFGDVPAAAAEAGVHPNTFRYRLRRLTQVAGLDLSDPVERLVLHLQLHLDEER